MKPREQMRPLKQSEKIAIAVALIAAAATIIAAIGPKLIDVFMNRIGGSGPFRYSGYVYEIKDQNKSGVGNATLSIVNHPEIFPAASSDEGYFEFHIPSQVNGETVLVKITADFFKTHTQSRTLSRDNSNSQGDVFILQRVLPGSVNDVRRSVAVLGFKNLSNATARDPIATQLSEMLTTELAASNRLRTITGEDVARMKRDLRLPEGDSYSLDTRRRIHGYLNVDDVVMGSYLKSKKGLIRVDVRLQDTVQDSPLVAFQYTDSEEQLPALIGRVGVMLRNDLGVGQLSEIELAAVKAALPSNPRSVPFYFEGLEKIRTFENFNAPQAPLQEVADADPNFPLAHAALAATWSKLGYENKAKTEAGKAFHFSGNLGEVDRQVIEAKYLETSNEWDKAAEIYRNLYKAFPDNLEYGLGLVNAIRMAGNQQDALDTLAGLKKLLPGMKNDPRIDLTEAAIAERIPDGQRETNAALSAKAKARALGAVLQEAQALKYECLGREKLGDLDGALEACKASQTKFNDAGDRDSGAEALDITGNILMDRGEFTKAKAASQQALTVFEQLGDNTKAAGSMNSLGMVLDSQGELGASQQMYERALEVYIKIDDKLNQCVELHNIGEMLQRRGNLTEANKKYTQSLTLAQQLHHKTFEAGNWDDIGYIFFLRGDPADALKMFDKAESLLKEQSDRNEWAGLMMDRGQTLLAQNELLEARKIYQSALDIRAKNGAKQLAAESKINLAELFIEEGNPAAAVPLLQQAIETSQSEYAVSDEIWAREELAAAFLGSGRQTEAAAQIDSAKHLMTNREDIANRMRWGIVGGRIQTAAGKYADAKRSLDPAIEEARLKGFVKFQFEAQLALGEAELKSGKKADGLADLAELEKKTASRGLLLLAAKARAAGRQ